MKNEQKSQEAIFFREMQMATFSSREFTSCRALRITAEMAKIQIIICPTDIAKCQADETITTYTGATLRPLRMA